MAVHQSIEKSIPAIESLQSWSNDPDAARANLKALLSAIQSEQEEHVSWATEALENMGQPSADDIAWLGEQTTNESQDVVYWAVTLLSRTTDSIDAVQDEIAKVVSATKSTATIRRRALKALEKVEKRSKLTVSAIQIALNSDDSQLANDAKEIL